MANNKSNNDVNGLSDDEIKIDSSAAERISLNTLTSLLRQIGMGDMEKAYREMLYGFNHQNTLGGNYFRSRDFYGYTFFTKPMMNMTSSNLINRREFVNLLFAPDDSIEAAIRQSLDSVAARSADVNLTERVGPHRSSILEFPKGELVDSKSPFIMLLSNNLMNMTGWPDVVMQDFVTEPGKYGQQMAMADGKHETNEVYDLNLVFKNLTLNPIIHFSSAWVNYMSLVRRGSIYPYAEAINQRYYDYFTGIWRFSLDESKRFITNWCRSGLGAFPTRVPWGELMNFNIIDNGQVNTNNREINIPFKMIGANYNDPILFDEFNTLCIDFNPDLAIDGYDNNKELVLRNRSMIKLKQHELANANNHGYPLINELTKEFCWYIHKDEYNKLFNGLGDASKFNRVAKATGTTVETYDSLNKMLAHAANESKDEVI